MISESDKKTIREPSKKYPVKKVLLFGSSLDPVKEGRDIDLVVEGIDPKEFFDYYGDLLLRLSKPVDLIKYSLNKEDPHKEFFEKYNPVELSKKYEYTRLYAI